MKTKVLLFFLILSVLVIPFYFTMQVYGTATAPTIQMDRTLYSGYGKQAVVTLTDNTLNVNKNSKEEIQVSLNSSSDVNGITLVLTEKSSDSGVFTGSFGFTPGKSDKNARLLHAVYNDKVKVTYNGISSSSVWKSYDGTIRFDSGSYSGLLSKATVSVTDQDLNVRPDFIDSTSVILSSSADPKGLSLVAYETGSNTGIFTIDFGFSKESTDSRKKQLKILPMDTIVATYYDAANANNSTAVCTSTSKFQFVEATVRTSAAEVNNTGNMLKLYISDQDANHKDYKDRITASVSTVSGAKELTVYLDETGNDTGNFEGVAYLTHDDPDYRTLQIDTPAEIIVSYTDKTVPTGESKEITQRLTWQFTDGIMTFDKETYSGYNAVAKITLYDMKANKTSDGTDYVSVRVSTADSSGIMLKLKETGKDTGQFKGSVTFGRTSSASKEIVKVSGMSAIYATYKGKSSSDAVECSADWTPQDGQLTLDRSSYVGYGALVNITIMDLDLGKSTSAKDEVQVRTVVVNKPGSTVVTLTETGSNSGIFTGVLYLNGKGGKTPSLDLKQGEQFEITYRDQETESGSAENRIASATWDGLSEAKLTLDKTSYTGYGSTMKITLEDPGQNKDSLHRDNVAVRLLTKQGGTSLTVTLTETDINSGIYTANVLFDKPSSSSASIKLRAEDEIEVTFTDSAENKKISAKAVFKDK